MNRKLFSIGAICFVLLFFIAGFVYAQDSRPIVRLIYFLPKDRQPQPDINAKLDKLIKDTQQLFANQMEAHGFGRKTFQFETDAEGNAVVHHFIGEFTDEHYSNLPYTWDIWGEIDKQFDASKNIYLTVIDMSSKDLDGGGIAGRGGSQGSSGGKALITVSTTVATAHELGHAFGLFHDYRPNAKRIRKYTTDWMLASFCAADRLDVHPAFNPERQQKQGKRSHFKMLPPSLVSPPNVIRLRFEISDPNGINQVQLFTSEIRGGSSSYGGFLGCKYLNGNPHGIVEFVTPGLTPNNKSVQLAAIDVPGNVKWSQGFPIDITPLLPNAKVVSIPDANLAAAVRQDLRLSSSEAITTHAMLSCFVLYASNSGITDLTGLEHAHNLRYLSLGAEYIEGKGYVNSNTVLNLQPLSGLTNLKLDLRSSNISDISALSALKNLNALYLSNNNISDISALLELTNLTELWLQSNNISDISALSGLTNLKWLYLSRNNISDISALSALKNLNALYLSNNNISDISALSGLTNLHTLRLHNNNISDISALSTLKNLNSLWLQYNNISDISTLSALKNLTWLNLYNNNISDISPLLALNLTGVEGIRTGLYLQNNPLSYTAINTHIPAMQAKGIEISYFHRTPTKLLKISGDAQQAVTNSELPLPFVIEVQDQWNRAFAEVPITFSITEGSGKLSTLTTTTDTKGRAKTRLTFGQTEGEITIRATAAKISQPIQFTVKAILSTSFVQLPDTNLTAKIAETLGKPTDASMTTADMLTLTSLTANNANISNLTRLQHASNLTTLTLDGNNLSNIDPLTGLTQLTTLSLDNNNLSNIAPLVELAQLETLSLENNNLSDIAPLVELTKLKTLRLRGNLLSYPSLYTTIPTLRSSSVDVEVDTRTPTTLINIPGTPGVAGAARPVLVQVEDQNGIAFAGVPVTFTLTAAGGYRSTSKATSNRNGKAITTLTLGPKAGENVVNATVTEIQQPLTFTITVIDTNTLVHIPDVNLRAKIAETLNKPKNATLNAGDLSALTRLDARNANIQNLTGIEYAHNLNFLNLGAEYIEGKGVVNSNTVSDLQPLSGLINLHTLQLQRNNIRDISALSALINLTSLYLHSNNNSDISALSALINLHELWLQSNNISDISALSGLTNLKSLYLSRNNISDISALSTLKNLKWLYLSRNNISDISALSALINLNTLELENNNISDISALSTLKNLNTLQLENNNISDISPLLTLNLTGTQSNSTRLYFKGNPLNNDSIRTHIPAMQARGIVVSFDNITHPELRLISGDKQEELMGKTLSSPFVVEYRDADGKPKEGVKVKFSIADGDAELTDTTFTTDAHGRAQTFLQLGMKLGTITVRATADGINTQLTFTASVVLPENHVPEDVNADGVVDVEDLVLVAATIGTTPPEGTYPNPDVNGDGGVNRDDLALVMAALANTPTAPAAVLTAENLQRWIDEAKQLSNKSETFQRGITVLEQLFAAMLPKKTALLANYPNPFNPETWIPYHLAKPTEVTVHIYAVNGTLIRTLALGHKPAGIYEHRTRAAYWDGRNALGESVASGVYFYTLTADDFTATRKMLIRK